MNRSSDAYFHISRVASLVRVQLPRARLAAQGASDDEAPCSCCSSASSSKCERSSRSRSASRFGRRHQRISALLSRPHDPRDGPRQSLPFRFFGDQLLLAGGSESIVFELALQILTGQLPLRGDPFLTLQAVQRGI